jgi:hypothetical protein
MAADREPPGMHALYAMLFTVSAALVLLVGIVLFVEDSGTYRGSFYIISALLFFTGAALSYRARMLKPRIERIYHSLINVGIILLVVGLAIESTGFWSVGVIFTIIGMMGGLRK